MKLNSTGIKKIKGEEEKLSILDKEKKDVSTEA